MTQRAYTIRFGPVDVHASSEAEAVNAAATLLRADPHHYKQQVLLWEGDETGKIAEPPTTA